MVTSKRTRRWGVVVAAAATVALLAPARPAAAAQTTCAVGALDRMQTDFGPEQVAVKRFDPALGHLATVTVERTVDADQESKVESRDPQAQQVRLRSTVKVTMTSPAFRGALPDITTTSEIGPLLLAPFDDSLDFSGKSGRSGLIARAPVRTSTVASSTPATLDGFTGQGSVTFVVRADGDSTFSGPGSASYETSTFASARVRVCYTYGLSAPNRSMERAGPATPAALPRSGGRSGQDETRFALVLLSAGTFALLVGSGARRPREV